MPLKNLLKATAALALAAFGAAAAAAQTTPLYVVEGGSRLVDLAGSGTGRATVYVSQAPLHGQLALAWPNLTYKPAAGYFGKDWVHLEILASGQTTYRTLEITVLPQRMALQAQWSTFSYAGVYDLAFRQFQVCDDVGEEETSPLSGLLFYPLETCTWVPVLEAPARAIPVVLFGEPGVADDFLLFAPETGTLYFLEPSGGTFVVVNRLALPAAIGRFPIAGRFAPGAPESIAFVGSQGQVSVLGPSFELTAWSQPIWVGGGSDLVWPVRWYRSGHDALAVIHPSSATLNWRDADGSSGAVAVSGAGDLRRPVDAYNNGSGGGRVLALAATPMDGDLIFAFRFGGLAPDSPTPNTYPLKFPDDPPGP